MKRLVFLFCFLLVFLSACSEDSADLFAAAPEEIGFTEEFAPKEEDMEGDIDGLVPLQVEVDTANEEDGVTPGKAEVLEKEVIESQRHKTYIKSMVSSLTVRSAAGASSSPLGYLDAGDMVVFVGREGDWYETRYVGKKAYVSARNNYTTLVEMEISGGRIEEVISLGEQLLGTPYVYGAVRLLSGGRVQESFDISKFDCSSFMQYIFYYGSGVVLRETTRTQVGQGTEVKREELRRGDLIFMTNSSRKNLTGTERIGHVALYLGDNYILHTASDHAVIEKMSATRWNNYITARRLLE